MGPEGLKAANAKGQENCPGSREVVQNPFAFLL